MPPPIAGRLSNTILSAASLELHLDDESGRELLDQFKLRRDPHRLAIRADIPQVPATRGIGIVSGMTEQVKQWTCGEQQERHDAPQMSPMLQAQKERPYGNKADKCNP